MSAVVHAAMDGMVIAKRNVIKIKRVPEVLVFVLISPIMFVLLFAYVFGGAIDPGGSISYREFLVAGIFAQTVVFGAAFTGAGLAEDMQKGIIDRFRSLPMSPSAVLVGRTGSDVLYNVLSLLVMTMAGLLVGWTTRSSLPSVVAGFALLLLFAYAFSWVMAFVGLLVPSVEVINNAAFVVIMPVTFLSNAFVPLDSFPSALRPIVEWNPISALTQAVRERFGNVDQAVAVPDVWSLQNPELYTLLCVGTLLFVFVPLAIRQYQRTAGR